MELRVPDSHTSHTGICVADGGVRNVAGRVPRKRSEEVDSIGGAGVLNEPVEFAAHSSVHTDGSHPFGFPRNLCIQRR
jgi:hypothetical protein